MDFIPLSGLVSRLVLAGYTARPNGKKLQRSAGSPWVLYCNRPDRKLIIVTVGEQSWCIYFTYRYDGKIRIEMNSHTGFFLRRVERLCRTWMMEHGLNLVKKKGSRAYSEYACEDLRV